MSLSTITPQELYELLEKGEPIDLIDVRTPVEYREIHVSVARNVPLDRLDPVEIRSNGSNGSAPVYVICRSGNRAKQACEKLIASGITRVVNVDGGTLAWDQAGLPVIRGKKAISLERQVRIVAGFMVLVGATLGFFVNPYWFALAAFVGAGLIFAGITDTCGMAMILAKMPWNQVSDTPPAAGAAKTVDQPCAANESKETSSCCG